MGWEERAGALGVGRELICICKREGKTWKKDDREGGSSTCPKGGVRGAEKTTELREGLAIEKRAAHDLSRTASGIFSFRENCNYERWPQVRPR